MQALHFYAVIIGSEILNGRRNDAHFTFVQKALGRYGQTLFASFIIKDDAALIRTVFNMVKNDPQGVMFSFGGIGSTPDDLTRAIAAEVFTHKPLVRHPKFEQDIIARFGDAAYPHRVHMADLPEDATLLANPVNNMSGFALEARYFFVPGFPEMSHPMIETAINTHFAEIVSRTTLTLTANCSENDLIHLMTALPNTIELSSLPQLFGGKPRVAISLSGSDASDVAYYFESFTAFLKTHNIPFLLEDAHL